MCSSIATRGQQFPTRRIIILAVIVVVSGATAVLLAAARRSSRSISRLILPDFRKSGNPENNRSNWQLAPSGNPENVVVQYNLLAQLATANRENEKTCGDEMEQHY